MNIKDLLMCMEQFRNLNPNMPIQQAQTFLYICQHENNPDGLTIKDISDALGFSHASASRNVAAFTDWSRHRRSGHDLVVALEDPMDRSRKLVSLNAQGVRMKKLLEAQ